MIPVMICEDAVRGLGDRRNSNERASKVESLPVDTSISWVNARIAASGCGTWNGM